MPSKITLKRPVTLPAVQPKGHAMTFNPGYELDLYKLDDGTLLARHDESRRCQWAGEIRPGDFDLSAYSDDPVGKGIQKALNPGEHLMSYEQVAAGAWDVRVLVDASKGFQGLVEVREVEYRANGTYELRATRS